MNMSESPPPADEVPAGAAVFPLIPEELGVHPLLLMGLHAIVFFDGSSEDVVHPAAAEEAIQFFITYLRRLQGADLQRVREDIECLIAYGRQEKWPKEEMDFLSGFVEDFFVGKAE